MRHLGLVACAACGRLGFDGVAAPAEVDAPDDAAATCVLAFDTLPADLAIYGEGTIDVVDGRLRARVPGASGVDAGVTSSLADRTGRAIAVELVQAAPDGRVQTSFGWHHGGGPRDSVHLDVEGDLRFSTYDPVQDEYTDHARTPYDPAMHRWLRLRSAGAMVHGESSPDGVAWTELGAVAFDGADVRWDLGAGVYNAPTGPAEALFDNLTDCP